MLKNFVLRKGLIQGQTVLLEGDTGLPDGQEVLVGIGVPVAPVAGTESAREELLQELEAEEALKTIYRMRHTGRSIREL
jgi:hypothetical protein